MPLASTNPPKSAAAALNLTVSAIEITRQLCDIASVSGNEREITDAIQFALNGLSHLEITRDGDAIVARTTLGRSRRVVIAGHTDTVPVNQNLPSRFETDNGIDYLWGDIAMRHYHAGKQGSCQRCCNALTASMRNSAPCCSSVREASLSRSTKTMPWDCRR